MDLSDLLPKAPLEELIMRSALGLPNQPPIEVGLHSPRYGQPRGTAMSNRQLALVRALGGVSYPADREDLVTQAERWLGSFPDLMEALGKIPDTVYGGELEVMRELESLEAEPGPHSAGEGKDSGSSANR